MEGLDATVSCQGWTFFPMTPAEPFRSDRMDNVLKITATFPKAPLPSTGKECSTQDSKVYNSPARMGFKNYRDDCCTR
jgi:hypothetical protein